MDSQKVRLFSPKLEKTYFFFLGLFFILAALAITGTYSPFNSYNKLANFIVAFIFLDILHVYFTGVLLFILPEYRSWLTDMGRTKWIYGFVLIILSIVGYACVIYAKIEIHSAVLLVLECAFSILRLTHFTAQTKGLSILYNNRMKPYLSDAEISLQRNLERRERFCFNAVLAVQIGYFLITRFLPSYTWELRFAYFGLVSIFFTTILIGTFRYPQSYRSSKKYFVWTLAFVVLWPLYPVAMFFQRALHGMEYTFLSFGMVKKSSLKMNVRVGFYFFSSILVLAVVAFLYKSNMFLQGGIMLTPQYQVPLFITAFSLEYLHYYLDSQIFRFRKAEVRKHISPLIKAS